MDSCTLLSMSIMPLERRWQELVSVSQLTAVSCLALRSTSWGLRACSHAACHGYATQPQARTRCASLLQCLLLQRNCICTSLCQTSLAWRHWNRHECPSLPLQSTCSTAVLLKSQKGRARLSVSCVISSVISATLIAADLGTPRGAAAGTCVARYIALLGPRNTATQGSRPGEVDEFGHGGRTAITSLKGQQHVCPKRIAALVC